MTFTEWKNNQALCEQTRHFLESEFGKLLVAALETENPALHEPPPNSTPDDKIRHLGRIEGFFILLHRVKALAKYDPPKPQPQTTYDTPQ